MKNNILIILLCLSAILPLTGKAQELCMHSSAASLIPLGVMGSHTHSKGSWMFSYQLMHMNMQDNLSGRESIGQESILDRYMMAPGSMGMQMHMAGAMYALTDKLTLMAMLPYMSNHMQMVDRMGMASEMHSSHLGDVSISGLYSLYKGHRQSLHISLGLSIPTGSISESASIEHMHPATETCLPYQMQTGSGTWDLLPALTYTGVYQSFAYGLQGQARLRTGENSRAYRLGHMTGLNSWLAYRQNNWLSYSLRLQALKNQEVTGQDIELNPMMSPTSDALNSGGKQLNAFVGANFSIGKEVFKGHRLGIEYGLPLYQNLNGIQMQGKGTLLAGWQVAF